MSLKIKNILHRLLPGFLAAATALPAAAYPLSYYKTESALSQGHWVKITVDGEGIFQVSDEDLRAWGFSDPSKVCVFGYSPLMDISGQFLTTHVDDLPMTASVHTDDGRLLFYGESDARISIVNQQLSKVYRNQYDRRGVYFLSDSQPSKKVPVTSYRPSSYPAFKAHYHLEYIENELNNPGQGGVYYHDKPMSPGESRTFSFRVKDFDNTSAPGASGDGYFRYEYAQDNSTRSHLETTLPGNVTVSYSYDSDCPAKSNPSFIYETGYGTVRFRPLADNANSLKDETVSFTVTNPAATKAIYAAIDRATLSYPRTSRLGDDPQLIMQYYTAVPEGQCVEIRDTPAGTLAWNVDNPFSITSYEIRRADTEEEGLMRIALPQYYNSRTNPCRIIVFNPAATHPAAQYAGEVRNSNIHGSETPEMAIITTASLANEARELAAIHESLQGLKVSVFVQDDIFNEFSSGVFTPMAYRRMAKMFYDREPDVFKYLLLYGGGSWDNRGIVLPKDAERLVTFQADIMDHARDYHRNYTSDQVFGMLEDDYTPSNVHFTKTQISVGRMNLSTPSQARLANAKIENFIKNPPTAAEYMRVAISSDQGNSNAHFKQSEESSEIFNENMPGVTITRCHVVNYPIVANAVTEAHNVLMDAFRRGQGFYGYCGHGSAAGVTGVELLRIGQISSETFDIPCFAIFSSCDLFCFDRTHSLMDAMISVPTGGIIGGIGASRSVYLEYNQAFYLAVCKEYSTAQPGTTYGQLMTRARNALISSSSFSSAQAANTLCYNYIGDPALLMNVPRYKIVIDKINGTDYSAETEKLLLTPLTKTVVSGHLVRNDGGSAGSYNGTGLLEVYDTPRVSNEVEYPNSDSQKPPVKIHTTFDHFMLSETTFNVKDGHFEAEFVVPETATCDVLNRMVLTAKDDESGDLAAGTATNLAVTALPADFACTLDDSAPEIVSFYIDRPDFTSGDITGPDFTLYAEIKSPESGIHIADNGLTTSSYLTRDGSVQYKNILNAHTRTAEGNILIKKDFKGVTDGRHTFSLKVLNNLGNGTESELDFNVLNGGLTGQLTCVPETSDMPEGSPAIVRTSAELNLTHNSDEEPEARLLILDSMGNTVFTADKVSFPYTWDLKNPKGQYVADGCYKARAMLKAGSVFGGTAPVEFTIIR